MSVETIVILESSRKERKRAQDLLDALGYVSVCAAGPSEATTLVTSRQPAVLVASLPSQQETVGKMREVGMGACSLLLSFPAKFEQPQEVAQSYGADAYVLRPYRSETFAAAMHSALRIREVRTALLDAGSSLERERARLQRMGDLDSRTSFYHFEFFKRLLLFEMLRAKRYGYELSVCLVALDPLPGRERIPAAVRKELEAGVAVAIRSAVRDIDIPVHYSEGNYLVFLPHTDARGAERVGKRINQQIRRVLYRDGAVTVLPTASVGIAGLRKGKAVSFSRLIKDAQAALRAAQLKGGNQVILRA